MSSPLIPNIVNTHEVESDPEEDPIQFQIEGPVDSRGVGPMIENFNDSSSDEDDSFEPNQDLELHDVGEENDEEDVIDLPTYDEIIAEMEEDAAEMEAHAAEMELHRVAQEELIENLQAESEANKQKANDLMEVLERRWLDEAERSYQLQLQLDASQDEVARLQANSALGKRKYCVSLFNLSKRIDDFPAEAGKLGYNINKSVVTSMIHKFYKKARNF